MTIGVRIRAAVAESVLKSKATRGSLGHEVGDRVGTLTAEFMVDCNGAICVANTATTLHGRKPPCLIRVFRDEKLTLSAEAAKAGGRKSARGQVELEGTVCDVITRFGRRHTGYITYMSSSHHDLCNL